MTLTVGSFQFAASNDVSDNLAALERGIKQASSQGIRLLLTQECGVCGYPPVERDSAASVDQRTQLEALEQVSRLAKKYNMFVVVGLIMAQGPEFLNSMYLVRPDDISGQVYHKRTLWGWDTQNLVPGHARGVYEVDGIRVGMRICYEVRFPEYFRELCQEQVDLALVSLANVSGATRQGKNDVYRARLISRASKNVMWVLSANSTSHHQLAPSCLINPDGNIIAECKADQEDLLIGVITTGEPSFGAKGRIVLSRHLTGMTGSDKRLR